MFCPNCGTQLTQDTKFCSECGAAVSSDVQAVSQNPQPAPKKKKKTALIIVLSIIGGLIVSVVSFLLVVGVVSEVIDNPDYDDIFEMEEFDDIEGIDDFDDAIENYFNLTYQEIFTANNIKENTPVFDTEKTAYFASIDEEGYIEAYALGYDGDTVKNMNITVYLPIDDMTADEIPVLEQNLRKEFAHIEKEDFVTITYRPNSDNTYYEIYLEIDEVENRENIKKLQQWEYVDAGFSLYISYEKTRDGLLSDGYAEK